MAVTTTRQGDTWDILAKRLYGDEHYMEELVNANLNHRKTVVFSYGVRIVVPEIETKNDAANDLPPWKRQ